MKSISRYTLILITILTGAIFLPKLYWMAFDKPINIPLVYYSCEIKDHTLYDKTHKTYTDTKGNHYTRKAYERVLPLRFMTQLTMENRMPDSINGVAYDMHTFTIARSFTRIDPDDIQRPQAKLFPLFESNSGRANLQYPDDMFRINWRMEFINCNTNQIDEAKSQLFSAALRDQNFAFPAKKIAGIPTTRKLIDEGYFIVDAKDQLFHLKMITGKPYIKSVKLPHGLQLKHIVCVDHKDQQFYAFLLGNDGGIYVLKQIDYQTIHIPIDDYIAEEHKLRISSDYFNYSINVESDKQLKCYAFDKSFQLESTYTYTWAPNADKTVGQIAAAIFPFRFSLKNSNNAYIKIYPRWPKGLIWLIINGLFVLLQLHSIRHHKAKTRSDMVDLFLVLTTGIYGFIAIHIFPNNFE